MANCIKKTKCFIFGFFLVGKKKGLQSVFLRATLRLRAGFDSQLFCFGLFRAWRSSCMSHALERSCFFFSLIFALGSLWCHHVLRELISRKEESQSVAANDTDAGKWAETGLFVVFGSWLIRGCVRADLTDTVFSAWWWMYPEIYLSLGWKKAGKVMSLALRRLP